MTRLVSSTTSAEMTRVLCVVSSELELSQTYDRRSHCVTRPWSCSGGVRLWRNLVKATHSNKTGTPSSRWRVGSTLLNPKASGGTWP